MNQSVDRLVKRGLILLSLAFLLVGLTVFGATSPQRRRPIARSRGVRRAVDLFMSNCARCHGADGRGDTPLGHTYNAPDFTDPGWWEKHSQITNTRSLISIVSHGKGGMPAFGKKLERSEIKLLVNYVRHFRN